MRVNIFVVPTDTVQSASWLAGFCLAFPFAYPSVPYYWVAFSVFGLMFLFGRRQFSSRVLVLIILGMLSALLSSYVGLSGYDIGERQVIGSVLFYCFFIFGSLIPDLQRFYKGLFAGVCTVALLVIICFFIERPYEAGLEMFSLPEYRLWGVRYFPDWPNYLAFLLALGFLLGMFIEHRPKWALVCLAAAFMTTSRTPLFALAIFMMFTVLKLEAKTRVIVLASCVGTLLLLAVLLLPTLDLSGEFFARMFLFSDRAEVYLSAVELIKASPVLGSGAVLLDERVGNFGAASFHNTYLDIFVRQGLLGFLVFLALIVPLRRIIKREYLWVIAPFVLYFLICSFFQNFLKHPHFLMIYSVLLIGLKRHEDA
jgi:O-antigen ligase